MKRGVRELAKKTGYSVATISRVMNGSDTVKKDTREFILQAACEMNFIPNPAAKALATQRTHIIGAVIPTIDHSIFAKFIQSIEMTLIENGYTLVIATTDFDVNIEKIRSFQLINMGAEALIVSGMDHDEEMLSLATARGVPVLCTSVYKEDADLPTIGYDGYRLGRKAARHLAELGHENVAIIHGGLAENDRTQMRVDGVLSVFKDQIPKTIIETQLSVQGGASAAQQLFKMDPKPTAILCLTDILALGVVFEAQRQGIHIPDELSVMGFDNLEWASVCYPALTTISLPVIEMGRSSAQALVDYLEKKTDLVSKHLEGQLIIRDSTGKPIHMVD